MPSMMMKTAIISSVAGAAAASVNNMNAASDGRISLVTFDGNPSTTFNFTEASTPTDPKGPPFKSSGTWNVTNGYAALNANVYTEWGQGWDGRNLYDPDGWPGLVRVTAQDDFPDASSTLGGSLVLQVRSTTPDYTGFRITLATTEKWGRDSKKYDWGCSYEMGPFANRGCYKASFTVPPSADFIFVEIPLTTFSGAWLYGPGKTPPGHNCTESKIPGKYWPHLLPDNECLTTKTLAGIKQISFWAEGVEGKVNLDVKSITAVPTANTSPKANMPSMIEGVAGKVKSITAVPIVNTA